MAIAGGIGARVDAPRDIALHAWAFGEDQGRYVVTMPETAVRSFLERAAKAGVPAARIGATEGSELTLDGCNPISLQRLRTTHEGWLPAYMAALPEA